MTHITINLADTHGKVKPMHAVNNGPAGSAVRGTSNIELFRAAGIKNSVANAPADIRAMTDITVGACLKGGVAQVLDSFDTIIGDFEQLTLDV